MELVLKAFEMNGQPVVQNHELKQEEMSFICMGVHKTPNAGLTDHELLGLLIMNCPLSFARL